jgi:hypothetical protein
MIGRRDRTTLMALNQRELLGVFGRTGAVVAQNGDYTTSQVTNVPAGQLGGGGGGNVTVTLPTTDDTVAGYDGTTGALQDTPEVRIDDDGHRTRGWLL